MMNKETKINGRPGGIVIKKVYKNMDFRYCMEERLGYLRTTKEKLKIWMKDSPQGKIHVVRSGKRIQYYLRKDSADKSGKYLSKNKQKTIQTYLQKSYNEKALRIIEQEIKVLEKFLEKYHDFSMQITNLYSCLSEQEKEYIHPIDMSDEDYVAQWRNVPFVPKKISEQEMTYITDRGEYVRSKSELNIANTLNKMNVPYKYECPLKINQEIVIYPDFTVLNIKDREEHYWEHRGMMDDRDYARHSVARLKDYEKCGIYPGKGLVITEETWKSSLGSQEIMDIINTYFR